jgi:hypothetical protein
LAERLLHPAQGKRHDRGLCEQGGETTDRPGTPTTWGESTVRFVRPDVALAYRDYSTVGHKTPNGQEMPERKTHATWFLTKESGKWRIASHVICDDNAAAVPAAK